jgi:hypothetical protein
MKTITCMCEHSFDADFPDEVDLDREPQWLAQILSGDLFKLTCPKCGKVLKPEFPLRLSSVERKLDLFLIPETERTSFYRGDYKVPAGASCVIGFPELLDRVKVLRDGLDVRAIEIMKYVYLSKAEESNQEADISVCYFGKESGALCFHIYGLSADGKIAVIKAPLANYESLLQALPAQAASDPYKTIVQPPYVSVRRFEMLGE